jgi:hypothetical protein
MKIRNSARAPARYDSSAALSFPMGRTIQREEKREVILAYPEIVEREFVVQSLFHKSSPSNHGSKRTGTYGNKTALRRRVDKRRHQARGVRK